MRSTRTALSLISLIGLLAVSACGSDAAGGSEESVELDMYTHVGLDHPVNVELQQWADDVEGATEGRVNITLRTEGELPYTQDEGLSIIRGGLMEAGLVAGGSVGGDEPLFDIPGLPFLVQSQDDLDSALPVFAEHLNPVLEEEHNLVPLGHYVWPAQTLWLEGEDINELDDVAGKSVRVFNTAFAEASEHLGMVPVTLPAAEVNPSLQRGVIGGAWTSVSHAVGSSLPELVGTAVRTNAGYIYDVFGIRKDQWEALSKDDQLAIEDAAEAATERLMDVQVGSGQEEFWTEVQDAGLNIVDPDESELRAISEDLASSYEEWAEERGPEAIEFLEAVQEEIN